jgi:GAF domain-containing protein
VADPGDRRLQRTLVELVGLLPGDESYEQTLDRLVDLARDTVPGCDWASVSLLAPRRPVPAVTVARTDGLAERIDLFQYQQDDGPCLQAARESRVYDVPSYRTEERWGAFPSEALRHGVLASLSLPLAVRAESLGALNLYARTEEPYTETAREIARLFAAHAAVAITNARIYDASRRLTEQMQDALRSRAVIEQAKGILMAERHCDEATAFDLLRGASQRENVKLREVAQRLVDSKSERGPEA